MQRPALILCDEPIASLDPKSSKVVMDYLRQVTKRIRYCLSSESSPSRGCDRLFRSDHRRKQWQCRVLWEPR